MPGDASASEWTMPTASDLIANLDRLGAEFDAAIAPLGDEQAIALRRPATSARRGQAVRHDEGARQAACGRPGPPSAPRPTRFKPRRSRTASRPARRARRRRRQARPRAHRRHHAAGASGRWRSSPPPDPGPARGDSRIFAEIGVCRRGRPADRDRLGHPSRRSRSPRITPRATCRTRSTCPRDIVLRTHHVAGAGPQPC